MQELCKINLILLFNAISLHKQYIIHSSLIETCNYIKNNGQRYKKKNNDIILQSANKWAQSLIVNMAKKSLRLMSK